MGVKENTVYMSSASILMSVIVIGINSYLLMRFVLRKHSASMQHYSILKIKMAFDWCFALVTVVYSGSVISRIYGITGMQILFYCGNVIQSMEAALGVLNVFIASDRLCAMRKPLHYSRYYNGVIQKTAIATVSVGISICFVTYSVTRPNMSDGYMFTHLVNRLVQSIIHLTTVGILLFSMVVTAVFLYDFHGFLKKQRTNHLMSYTRSVNAANRVVVYLMAIEFVCLVVPNFLEVILRHYFDIRMGNFGPIIHPLYVLYMTISSVMFIVSVANKPKSSPPSTNHAVHSSRTIHPEPVHSESRWISGL
ncbi:hypothetical protein QR680_010137 [Steinernema hermaphroditum]|uniref:Uncharacterized protein n=1 Tax=Steinernema hermaphroditum TaxID=289476 RepID=A0AA39IQH8_9BILA|nr:hypothetical protein QR680_010137 [Steinernema hermaphroditum]